METILQRVNEKASKKEVTEPFNFIPNINCPESASNGIILIQVTNIKELWEHGLFKSMHQRCFQLIYNKDSGANTDIDNLWRCRTILLGNINGDGSFHIKLPVHLHHYTIQFCLQAINVKTRQFMSKSAFHLVNIPSFLADTSYAIGDVISFRDENTFYVKKGQIIQPLPDNKFKLGYVEYDKSLGEPQQKHAWLDKECIIDKSRIYREGLELQYETDMIDPSAMRKLLLIKRNDEESIAIFNTLYDIYSNKSLVYCIDSFGLEESLIYWEPMAIFVAKNIFDFLYKKQFEYKVNCLMNPYNDGRLEMVNLRQSDIRTYYKGSIGGAEMGIAVFDEDDIDYSCDWCRNGLRGWHYVYQCSTSYCDRHDICLNCVFTVIKLGTELQQWLQTILNDELNVDCVNLVVDYVIGTAICL